MFILVFQPGSRTGPLSGESSLTFLFKRYSLFKHDGKLAPGKRRFVPGVFQLSFPVRAVRCAATRDLRSAVRTSVNTYMARAIKQGESTGAGAISGPISGGQCSGTGIVINDEMVQILRWSTGGAYGNTCVGNLNLSI